MPEYDVRTDQGTFRVQLDREPTSDVELRQAVEERLRQPVGPQQQFPAGVPVPDIPFQPKTPSPVPGIREPLRQAVSDLPFVPRVAAETLPSVLGSLLFPSLGGAVGESAAQLVGLAPESPTNLALSAIPFGKGAALAGRAGRGLLRGAPGVRQAVQSVQFERLGKEAPELTAGFRPATPASDLYDTLAKAGVRLKPQELPRTLAALDDIQKEALQFATTFESGKDLLGLIARARTAIRDEPLNFDQLVRVRRMLGHAAKKYERESGERLGGAKVLTSAIIQDMEQLAKPGLRPSVVGPAKTALAAINAAKRDFAVDKLEEQLTKLADSPESVLRWFNQAVNPKAGRKFERNFADSLKSEIPGIRQLLERAVAAEKAGTTGKAGIIVSGRMARAGEEAMKGAITLGSLGFLTGGPIAAGIGAMIGANAQTWIAQAMLTKPGRAVLDQLLKEGESWYTPRAIQALAQVVRGVGRGGVEEAEPMIQKIRQRVPGLTFGPPEG